MSPTCLPDEPDFADPSEQVAWDSLRRWLRPDDVLLHGVRFTDPQEGDVEVDLLVLMPDVGAVVIEVKGGHVSFADGRFRQSGADGVHVIDPIGQARRGVYALKRFLESRPDWSRGSLRATWLVCFPYTDVTGDLGPQGRRGVVVGRSDVPELARWAHDRLQDPGLHAPYPPAHWIDVAVSHLWSGADAPAEIAARTAARLRRVDQLTKAQADLLGFAARVPRYEITGAAGTGKTWLAMEQARRWARAGERVCLVSYGRGVAASMDKALADLPAVESPAFVGTFHELGRSWGVVPHPDAGPEYWEDEAPRLMHEAATALPDPQRFTAFVVDEAQDFADAWWPALLASAASPEFRLAVLRDDEQEVFAGRRGRPDLSLVPFTLTENLRNPVQVVDSFRPLIRAEVVARGGSGPPVEFRAGTAADVFAEADAVVEELLDRRGWLPEHVALLTTRHRHPVHVEWAGRKEEYWESFWENDVFYSTVAGFKGLERPVVVLAVDGFHEGVDPRSVMYAGMSRARDLLVVVADPDLLGAAVGDKVMRRLQRGRPA